MTCSLPTRRPLRRKIFFGALCLLLQLGALEGVVRARAWLRYGSASDDLLRSFTFCDPAVGLRVPRPNYRLHARNVSVTINSLGFRGHEISRERPPRTLRIACLGGSTTYCGEASCDEATWPQQLEDELARIHSDVRVEVVNAGIPGYTLEESLKNLERRVLPLEPDLLIYYEANNELCKDSRKVAESRGLVASTEAGPVLSFLRRSLLFDLLYMNYEIRSARTDSRAGKLTSLPRDMTASFEAKLERLRRTLEARRIPLVLSTFQVKYRHGQARDAQIRNADVSFFYMPWMTIDALLEGIDRYNDAIVAFARAHGLVVAADRDAVPADAEHFADCMHFHDPGCTVMARRFAQLLERSGILEPILARKRCEGLGGPTGCDVLHVLKLEPAGAVP
jgi:lysophospholipase L1-like esterase